MKTTVTKGQREERSGEIMQYQSIYKFQAFRIVFIYAIFGTTWILFSDMLMFQYIPHFKSFSLIKGLFYVAITSLLVLYLLKKAWGEIDQSQKRLHTYIHTDSLTNLHNRLSLQKKLDILVKQNYSFSLLFINADRFKVFNEQFGHAFGDEVLKQIALRMLENIPKKNTTFLARWGADEYILIVENTDSKKLKSLVMSLQRELEQPMTIFEQKVSLSFSMGCALFPIDAQTADDCIRFAELALHDAKLAGGRTLVLYKDELSHKALKRFELEGGLKHAIQNDELFVVYQPQVSTNTGKLIGFEGLLRWNFKGEKLISPAEFIPIAEESGLIVQIGEFVLLAACKQVVNLKSLGHSNLVISVNVSSRQFYQDDFVKRTLKIVNEEKVNPSNLMIEITESIVMEYSMFVMQSLSTLKEAGFQIAIDDFGTGYSSFKYLEELPLDMIKIDQSFIQSIHKPRTVR